ncbi:MAG: SUMF1/EgtB/PvdO family nonheme iron enzyme [Kofleriaceae bacterium]
MNRAFLVAILVACEAEPPKVDEPPQDPTFAFAAGRTTRRYVCDEGYADLDDSFRGGRIDRRTVTCRDYRACAAAGGCPPTQCAEWREFFTTYERAVPYCQWKGGMLPTFGQWERAVRGPKLENRPPFTDVKESCWVPTSERRAFPRCEFVTLEGVVYWTRSDGEWSRSSVCGGRVVANTYDHDVARATIEYPGPAAPPHEFRCVYEDPAPEP